MENETQRRGDRDSLIKRQFEPSYSLQAIHINHIKIGGGFFRQEIISDKCGYHIARERLRRHTLSRTGMREFSMFFFNRVIKCMPSTNSFPDKSYDTYPLPANIFPDSLP